jgi:hypothetical protein
MPCGSRRALRSSNASSGFLLGSLFYSEDDTFILQTAVHFNHFQILYHMHHQPNSYFPTLKARVLTSVCKKWFCVCVHRTYSHEMTCGISADNVTGYSLTTEFRFPAGSKIHHSPLWDTQASCSVSDRVVSPMVKLNEREAKHIRVSPSSVKIWNECKFTLKQTSVSMDWRLGRGQLYLHTCMLHWC